jgi:hypothetical protein
MSFDPEGIGKLNRDTSGWPVFDRFGQDLRHALRRLRGQPATALLAVALLALAIGMSSAITTSTFEEAS